jgi:hypothetical protein
MSVWYSSHTSTRLVAWTSNFRQQRVMHSQIDQSLPLEIHCVSLKTWELQRLRILTRSASDVGFEFFRKRRVKGA